MHPLEQHLDQLYTHKKVLILGWGREGKSTYTLLRKLWHDKVLTVADQEFVDVAATGDANLLLDPGYLENLLQYDVIFKTPGISMHLPELQNFLENGKTLTSQLNEFLAVYREKTIGVTGTKGKSTTTALLAHVLSTAGKRVVMGGNIGRPVWDMADEIQEKNAEWIVLELSSYMLDMLSLAKLSPHVSLFLNLFEEHLNYHDTMAAYFAAKQNITKFQTDDDLLFFNSGNEWSARAGSTSPANAIAFQENSDGVSDGKTSPVILQKIWPVVQKCATELGVSEAVQQQALETFQGLPHRLELIVVQNNVRYYDDTLATVPEAAIAALDALPNTSVLLLGGFDRGIDYAPIVRAVVERHIPHVLLFRPSGEKMHALFQEFPESDRPSLDFVEDMEDAVRKAKKLAEPNTCVVLSPASPSFGQFKDYEDKSAQFKHWLTVLANES